MFESVRRTSALALTAGMLLLAPAAGAAVPDDLRPHEAAATVTSESEVTDLRSPDARDAAATAAESDRVEATDLRSPDARDAASSADAVESYREAIVSLTREAQAEETLRLEAAGTDWTDVGIGAGGAAALLLAGFGTIALVSRRRAPVAPAHA